MKVLNKEVDSCGSCPCVNRDMMDEPYCNILNIDDKFHYNTIHKDCPFSKPITQEVIESFGFEYIKTHPGTTESYFELPNSEWGIDFDPDWNSKPFIRIYVFGCDGDTTYFSGTINNSIELEFILKNIGIIE